jgi:prevent-host-death family protein
VVTKRITTQQIQTHLAEYLSRAAHGEERIIVERQGTPVAALVSLQDLQRLEAWDAAADDRDPDRQAAFRRTLAETGIGVQWPTGTPLSPDDRAPLDLAGTPLSEQIIADRR